MGATISSFKVFHELARNGKSSWQYKRLKQYRLFSFILHSPTKHKDFHIYLEDNLHRLDARSRGSLIFFTLVKPNEKFKRMVERQRHNRGYIQELEALEEGIGIGYNEDASVFVLCKDLGIPESALPCIVVTNDFIDGNIVWFSTNKRALGDDLSELNEAAEFESDDLLISAVRSNPKLKIVSTLEKSFAQILSEAFSLNASSTDIDADIHGAENVAKDKIRSLLQEVKEIKLQVQTPNNTLNQNIDIEENDILVVYEDMMTKILSQILSKYEMSRPSFELNFYKQFLEPKSFEFLLSGYKVLRLFETETDFDFSSAVMPMAKVLENEINHSIVQWLRKKLAIRFPDYFCRYEVGKNAFVRYRGKTTNLNEVDRETQSWKPLPIGISKYALEGYLTQNNLNAIPSNNKYYYFDSSQLADFNAIWEDIRLIRNKAGHSENLSIQDGLAINNKLKELLDKRYFFKLSLIKNNLRM